MKRQVISSPVLVNNPYNGKAVNVEPLFYLLKDFGSGEDISAYIDSAIRDLVIAYQSLSEEDRITMSCEISFLFDIRDMFDEISKYR